MTAQKKLAEPTDELRAALPGTLGDIFDVLLKSFRQRGAPPRRADVLQIVMVIAEQLGGRRVYLSYGDRVRERLHQIASHEADARPGALLDLYNALRAYFVRTGAVAPENDAMQVAALVSDVFCGVNGYLPRGDRCREALRNRQIYRDFDGHNAAELARLYCLSETSIRSILRRAPEAAARRQPKL